MRHSGEKKRVQKYLPPEGGRKTDLILTPPPLAATTTATMQLKLDDYLYKYYDGFKDMKVAAGNNPDGTPILVPAEVGLLPLLLLLLLLLPLLTSLPFSPLPSSTTTTTTSAPSPSVTSSSTPQD